MQLKRYFPWDTKIQTYYNTSSKKLKKCQIQTGKPYNQNNCKLLRTALVNNFIALKVNKPIKIFWIYCLGFMLG